MYLLILTRIEKLYNRQLISIYIFFKIMRVLSYHYFPNWNKKRTRCCWKIAIDQSYCLLHLNRITIHQSNMSITLFTIHIIHFLLLFSFFQLGCHLLQWYSQFGRVNRLYIVYCSELIQVLDTIVSMKKHYLYKFKLTFMVIY